MKNNPVGAEVLHADGRTDRRTNKRTGMTMLIAAFRNFANALRNEWRGTFSEEERQTLE